MDFRALVQELGIDKLPPDMQRSVFKEILATVQLRVGRRLSEDLSREQQDRLEEVLSKQGDDATLDELERLYPNYRRLYQEEVDNLKDELKALKQPETGE